MPDLSNYGQTVAQGIGTGMALPTRASGLADVIKSITNDLRAAASSRAESAKEAQKQAADIRGQNIDFAKSLLSTNRYSLKPGATMDDFINTGDFSVFTPNQSMMPGAPGGTSGMPSMRLEGVNAQGQPFYKANTIPADKAGIANLAKESLTNIEDVKNILFPRAPGTTAYNPSSYRRDIAVQSNLPMNQAPLIGAVIPSNVGTYGPQTVFRKVSAALSGRQLIQTGVAARPEETQKLIQQFAPSGLMSSQAALEGLTELENFYKDFIYGLQTGQIDWRSGKGGGIVAPGQGMMGQGASVQDVMGAVGMLQSGAGDVPVLDPNGNPGTVPREDLQQALSEGYTIQQ